MKILGVSNPRFVGVTVATKSYCTHHLAFDPLSHSGYTPAGAANHITQLNPDIVIIGGWSPNYNQLVRSLGHRHNRKFAVIAVWHGTHFHESFLKDWHFMTDVLQLQRERYVDYLAFPQPDAAAYFYNVKKMPAFFLPHTFPVLPRITPPKNFTIGLVGGKTDWKNYVGQREVIRDFQELHHGSQVIDVKSATSFQREDFLKELAKCSAVSHLSILDCYPNVVLEAWSMGIPVVLSPAAAAPLTNNLVAPASELRTWMKHLVCASHTNAYELYTTLELIEKDWERYSQVVHGYYRLLHEATKKYVEKGLKELCASFTLRKTQSLVLPTTFMPHSIVTPVCNPGSLEPIQITETGTFLST